MTKSKNSIKYGDIFQLGNHLIACGDARDKELIKKLVGKLNVRTTLTDVPYGVAYVESKKGFQKISTSKAIANDHIQSDEEYSEFTKKWLEAINPHLTRKNSAHIFNSDKMIFALRKGMLDAGFIFGQLLIWVKTQAVVGRMDYLPQHELIAYGWHKTHEFVGSKDKSVLIYPRPSKSPLHPTMKPVGLLRKLILNSSRIGDIVYDPFGGSGSTLIACEQTKRKCLMVELEPSYCKVVIERFEKLTGIKAEKII